MLRDVSFVAEPGETVALVGPTGGGKSTVINLLLRFYDVDSGSVAVDGFDVRDLTQASLRSRIALVPQDPFLFSGSIADNIRYGRLDATDEEVAEAAVVAGAHTFIQALTDGYGHPVGERGGNLSQGQRQLLAFARAVLHDPLILVLDEATASVDTRTERVLAAGSRADNGRTDDRGDSPSAVDGTEGPSDPGHRSGAHRGAGGSRGTSGGRGQVRRSLPAAVPAGGRWGEGMNHRHVCCPEREERVVDYEDFLEIVKKRRSHWHFRPDPVPYDLVEKVIDAARYAPSAFNSQPWDFVVIRDPVLQAEIVKVMSQNLPGPPPQMPIASGAPAVKGPAKDPLGFRTAPVLILVLGDTRVRPFGPPYVREADDRWRSLLTTSLAAAYEHMHLAAASLGLATRWVSAVVEPPIAGRIKELRRHPRRVGGVRNDGPRLFRLRAAAQEDARPFRGHASRCVWGG